MTDGFTVGSKSKEVRDALRPVLILIGETLERSVPIVLDSITRQDLPFSPFYFSSGVRCHLKKALLAGGFDPRDIEDGTVELTVNNVSNDGLDFHCFGLRLKVLKGINLPRASSGNREQFYEQGMFDFARSDSATAPLRNLVILWDVKADATIVVQLVAPKSKEGDILWVEPVPSPAEWIKVNEKLDSRDTDLPIKRKKKKTSDGDNS